MNVKIRDYMDRWKSIKNATMTTIRKDEGEYPSSEWKRRLILAEHSPIRKLHISWKWHDIAYWVSVHFTRHKYGIEHFVRTQRTDRTGINRDEIPQGALVEHECDANAQAIINISRKRLCKTAAKETRAAWIEVINQIAEHEPELANCCVPDCVYRGHCYEMFSCGYHKTDKYKKDLELYRSGINC